MASAVELSVLVQARRGLRALLAPLRGRAPGLERIEDFSIPGAADGLAARLYRAPTADAAPVIVYFHGGGFIGCDIETHDALCSWLAAASGGAVLSIDYRLAPETPFPGQLEDARAASAWALANAAQLGGRVGEIALAGDSAGAYLAASVALEMNQARPNVIALQVLLYPLVHLQDSLWAEEELRDFRFLGRVASLYIARAIGAEAFPSLLDLDLRAAPSTIIAGGGVLDPVRRDAHELAHALRLAGIAVEERTYRSLAHGGLSFAGTTKTATKAVAEVGALTRAMLAART